MRLSDTAGWLERAGEAGLRLGSSLYVYQLRAVSVLAEDGRATSLDMSVSS